MPVCTPSNPDRQALRTPGLEKQFPSNQLVLVIPKKFINHRYVPNKKRRNSLSDILHNVLRDTPQKANSC
jgi:hypothetical protein